MKVPLRYQVTEYDCGSVSLLNAISYLFEREEILPILAKKVSTITLDCKDDEGNVCQGGTSREAISKFCEYVNNNDYNITCNHLIKEEITLDKLINCVNNNGVIVMRCYQKCEHYVIITDIKDKAYIFDPYYLNSDYYDNDKEVEMVFNKPFDYNRVVSIERIMSETNLDFALGIINQREVLLLNRK